MTPGDRVALANDATRQGAVTVMCARVPYLWVLWDGTAEPEYESVADVRRIQPEGGN